MEMAGLCAQSCASAAFVAPKLSAQNRTPFSRTTGSLSCSSSSATCCPANGLPKPVQVGRRQSKFTVGIRCEAGSGTVSTTTSTEWLQKTFELPGFKRGCHIITQHINRAVPEISQFHVGIAHIFVMHTSASLTINENASPDVPLDMEDSLNRIVPEGNHYRHLDEGFDDMPAHVKASMMGSSLTIPIKSGRLHLGIWQGIWLNEHRNYGGPRSICITIQGQKRPDGSRAYR
ncbi:unnamed protein product [Calypogeia fissa]